MASAVLFDLFGTLVDYSPSWTEQGYHGSHALLCSMGCTTDYDGWLADWDATFDAMLASAEATGIEFSMHDAFAFYAFSTDLPPCTEHQIDAFLDAYLSEWSEAVQLIPGVLDMLDRLRADGRRLALVTNTHSARMVRSHLDEMGLAPHFDSITTSVEVGIRKPRREIFEHALSTIATDAEDAVFVGDTYTADVVGPEELGMRGYLIVRPGQDPPDGLPEDRRLQSVLDIEHVLP